MYLFLVILGLLLLPTSVHAALPTSPTPAVVSEYVKQVLIEANTRLGSATPSGSASPCPAKSEADAALALRSLFFELDEAVVQPASDLTRAACFSHDVQALERYLYSLIVSPSGGASADSFLGAAAQCDAGAMDGYRNVITFVWESLWKLRRLGLDPRFMDLTGTGYIGVPPPPSGAGSSADNALCPYHSQYAHPYPDAAAASAAPSAAANVGCQALNLPVTATPRLVREAMLYDQIMRRLNVTGTGLGNLMRLFHGVVLQLSQQADAYVHTSGIVGNRPSLLLPSYQMLFVETAVPNAGESGCFGWPSDVMSGPVTGKDIARQNYPPVLTRELAEVIAYIAGRDDLSWYEYLQAYDAEVAQQQEAGDLGRFTEREKLRDVNREHLSFESFEILTIRDPQRRYERLANMLHGQTRKLASHVVVLPQQAASFPLDGPPLRALMRDYAKFLSRMCVKRGCQDQLLKTIELSLRDECFSSFLMDIFFANNPTARTLPACRAIYTE